MLGLIDRQRIDDLIVDQQIDVGRSGFAVDVYDIRNAESDVLLLLQILELRGD